MPKLIEVTRDFGRGTVSLGTWRAAARAEQADQRLADAILRLISDWENTRWPDIARARNELRARAERLVPSAPVAAPDAESEQPEWRRNKDAATAMYEIGMKGHRP